MAIKPYIHVPSAKWIEGCSFRSHFLDRATRSTPPVEKIDPFFRRDAWIGSLDPSFFGKTTAPLSTPLKHTVTPQQQQSTHLSDADLTALMLLLLLLLLPLLPLLPLLTAQHLLEPASRTRSSSHPKLDPTDDGEGMQAHPVEHVIMDPKPTFSILSIPRQNN